jgi:hypothetical protein
VVVTPLVRSVTHTLVAVTLEAKILIRTLYGLYIDGLVSVILANVCLSLEVINSDFLTFFSNQFKTNSDKVV